MKKIIMISLSAFLLFSCSSIQQNKGNTNAIVLPAPNPVLPQTDFYLTESGVSYLNELMERDFSSGAVREYLPSQINSPMEIYVGETLVIHGLGANRIKLVTSPLKENFSFEVSGDSINFTGMYQGLYVAEVYRDFTYLGTLKIKNKLKYNFTEKDNYDIIYNAYTSNNLDLLIKSFSIYSVAFPNSNKLKDISFMIIELAEKSQVTELVLNQVKYLKSNFMLSEDEKVQLLLLEEKCSTSPLIIDNYYLDYKKENLKLNLEIIKLITRKGVATLDELLFLEQIYMDTQDSNVASLLSNLYSKNGDEERAKYFSSLIDNSVLLVPGGVNTNTPIGSENISNNKSEEFLTETSENSTSLSEFEKNMKNGIDALNRSSYSEALLFFNKITTVNNEMEKNSLLFYKGKTYFLLNKYDEALKQLEQIKTENDNSAEIYYYLGVIQHQKGNLDLAKEYLRKSRENNPNSTWGRKSSIYLLKL